MEKNKEKTVVRLEKEREKLGNSGVLSKVAEYLIKIINKKEALGLSFLSVLKRCIFF